MSRDPDGSVPDATPLLRSVPRLTRVAALALVHAAERAVTAQGLQVAVVVDGSTVAAVGISGGRGKQDRAIAETAISEVAGDLAARG